MRYVRICQVGALVAFVIAMLAAHLYYVPEEHAWPLLLISIAVTALGIAWKVRGPPPEYDGYASQGDGVLALGLVVFILAILLLLPSGLLISREPDFSSLAAIDAKVDRYLKTQQTDSSVLAAATFGGFDQGSAALDCNSKETHAALESLLDGVDAASKVGQQAVLLLIGMTDRMPLRHALKKQYESNVGLAAARVDTVRACLERSRPDAAGLIATMQTLRLTTGPAYSPQISEAAPAEAAKMALDRQVSALLFTLPKGAKVPSEPANRVPSAQRAQPEWLWLRFILLILGVVALLGLAAAILMLIPKRAASESSAGGEDDKKNAARSAAECDKAADALAHVREMHQMFAELRTQNFNFFLLIEGAAITAAAALKESHNSLLPFVTAFAAAVMCVIFFGIERRTVQMLGDAREELQLLEEPLGVNLSRRDKWKNAMGAGVRRRSTSHTTLYFAAFAIVYAGALIAIRLYYPW